MANHKKSDKRKNTIVLVVVSVVVVLCVACFIWWHITTKGVRKYERDNYNLKLYNERQKLQIAIHKDTAELNRLQRDARRIKPVYKSEKENK
jgi:flagellar basal body-associated protein FliL